MQFIIFVDIMTDYKSYLDNGIFDIQNGKFESAVENINKSLELKNDWEIPYFYRGVAYQAMEDFDEAMLDYTKALQINDKMTDAYYNRARITLSRKDIDNPNIIHGNSFDKNVLEYSDDEKFDLSVVQKIAKNAEYVEIPKNIRAFISLLRKKIVEFNKRELERNPEANDFDLIYVSDRK